MKTLIGITCALLLAACSDSSTAPVVVTPVGTFSLGSVDGRVPPATFGATQQDGPWFVRGSLTLTAGGTYTLSTTDSTRQGAVGTVTEAGTWTKTVGDSIQFKTSTPTRESGGALVTAAGITRVEFGHTYVWKRT